MPKYTLNYFNIRARAELSRLLFAAAGVEYEDHQLGFDQWGPDSEAKAASPLGQLPYLEIDGVKLPQSISIARYLAKEFNLAGESTLEQAKADAVVDSALDLLNAYFSKGVYKIDRNDEAWTKFRDDVKKHFANLEKLIGLYGSNGYSASNKLLWSDIFIYDVAQQICKDDHSPLDAFPNVKKVVAIVDGHSNISAYVKARKDAPF